MSRLLSEQEYRKTKAFKIKRWYRGEKDPYIGNVEVKPQTPFKEDIDTAKRRTKDEAMVRRMIYDMERNKKLAAFAMFFKISSVIFAFILIVLLLYIASYLPLVGETAMILFGIGFSSLLLRKNLMKKIIGLNIMDTAVYLFFAQMNPVPTRLLLMGIVVSVSTTALMLSLTVGLYRKYRTLDMEEISTLLKKEDKEEVKASRMALFYIIVILLLCSLLAFLYTNDLFTAYVFVEIYTLGACGLIMITQRGRAMEAAMRYMIMSLLGSGLLLMGICILYDITGHLLMSNIQESIAYVSAQGAYHVPLIASIGMVCVGLAIKSALYPFHTWLPDACEHSTVSGAAILSGIVPQGYFLLLIRILYGVVGFDRIIAFKIVNIFFVLGLLGMIVGSVKAVLEKDIRRMTAFSSVAQIGYIYMGFGLGTTFGMVAGIFHILSHAVTSPLLLIAGAGLTDASGGSRKFEDLTGSGYRNPVAGAAFLIGACSMVGIPLFSGFISKLLFAQAAVQNSLVKLLPALICLAISTVLSAVCFMRTVICIYTPANAVKCQQLKSSSFVHTISLLFFIMLNVALGCCSQPVVNWIVSGLGMLG